MNAVVVIPAHNEEASLGAVLERVKAAAVGLPIVVVDDGSTDRTRHIAAEHGATVVAHAANLGYLRAVQTGMRFTLAESLDYCLTLDADGQHDPAELVRLRDRALMSDRPDVVIGSRFIANTGYRTSLARRAGMVFFSLLTRWVAGQRVYDTTSGMRCWSRAALELAVSEGIADLHSEIIILALMRGLKVAEVPVSVRPRERGESMYNLIAALAYPFRTLLATVVLTRRARVDPKRGK